jgi:O-antigen biosynthesis protein
VATSKYDTTVDVTLEDNSHSLMVRLVGRGKRVLDVGCANGYLAEVLVGNGCTVSGVEFDPAAAEEARRHLEQLVVGDLEQLDLVEAFGEGRFDVVVMGDVLEHLRDPLPVLRSTRRLLAPGGYVVISIPNVAHGDVRLSLLQGRFDYRPLGLLDSTHVRFFTRDNLRALLHDAGFAATDFLRTTAPLFETELGVDLDREAVPPDVLATVASDPDATTYQFVVRAVPDGGEWLVERMRHEFEQRIERLEAELAEARARLAGVDDELARQETAHQERLAAYHEQVVVRDTELADLRQRVASLERSRAVRAAKAAAATARRLSGG